MRVLLTANASYEPPRGGATRSNLIWLDHLAHSGHKCRIVCAASGPGAAMRHHASIAVLAVEDPARRVQTLRREIHEFRPDWVLVSSEDLGHALLHEARHSAPGRIVYLAFSSDETVMGFAFPKDERQALVDTDPDRFMLPDRSDLRFNWVHARLAALDEAEMRDLVLDAWRMVVPKRIAAAHAATATG